MRWGHDHGRVESGPLGEVTGDGIGVLERTIARIRVRENDVSLVAHDERELVRGDGRDAPAGAVGGA
jgi:hypothetical protein